MSRFDLRQAQQLAESAARDVGEELRRGFGIHIAPDAKSEDAWDVVTSFDLAAERRLNELLTPFDSAVGFLGEEFGGDHDGTTMWVVDPIDGTGHFTRASPMCTTMIGLVVDDVVEVGVIYNFVTDEMYSCHRGGGTTLNGEPVRMVERSLRNSYVVYEINVNKGDNLRIYAELEARSAPMNVMAAGHGFAMVAGGRFDARVAKDGWGYPWDYAPGPLLVEEAGGKVTNLGRTDFHWRNFDMVAANKRTHADLTEGPDAIFPVD